MIVEAKGGINGDQRLCVWVLLGNRSVVVAMESDLVWIRPRKIEKKLREQGLKGSRYRPFPGEALEFINLLNDALSRPISLSDDTFPRVLPFILRIIQKHGNNSFGWVATTPWLVVMDPEKIKEILSRYEEFQKPDQAFVKLLLSGMASLEGEKWAKHRKIINPAFRLDKLKNVFPLMLSSCERMVESWEQLVLKDGSSCELDVWPHLENLTGEIISRAAFGSCYEQGCTIFQLQREYINLLKDLVILNYVPGGRFLPTKRNRRAKAISREVEALLMGIIEKRKLEVEKGGSNKDDLLGMLLESNSNMEMSGLTIEEIVQECKLFYTAGAETTASLVAWTLVLLSNHQDWQERARSEILQVFGTHQNPSFDGLKKLKVVGMILNEALRLYSPAYMVLKKVFEDTKLKEWLLPAGTEVIIPLSILHQDREIWGEDAKEFKPDRFSDGVTKAMKKEGVFMPFGSGPRSCIGQNFALLEAKMSLVMILQRFSLHLSPAYVHAPCAALNVRPQHGVNLILCKL